MNKRSFIKSLLLVAVAPAILIPKAKDAFKWKRVNDLWVVNPDYGTAPYEVGFFPFEHREFCGKWIFVTPGLLFDAEGGKHEYA